MIGICLGWKDVVHHWFIGLIKVNLILIVDHADVGTCFCSFIFRSQVIVAFLLIVE